VASIVEDLLMPPIGRVAGNLNFTNLYIPLSDKITPGIPLVAARDPESAFANLPAGNVNLILDPAPGP
jgi:large conductance mechanosensitive channel